MPRPNFFIVGAAKCGTTSMYEYLRPHPEVFMSPRKEPHFFARDLKWQWDWGITDEQTYLALFDGAGDAKRIGEASTWYLYSRAAPHAIKRFCPEARIIIMLRNPVDMIRSLHWHSVRYGSEDIEDFAKALAAEQDRRRGRRIPKAAPFVDALFYKNVPRYTGQVRRYFDTFGRENVLVILFDDLKEDTPREYQRVVAFLGVSPDAEPDFFVANTKTDLPRQPLSKFLKTHRWFHRLLQRATPLSWRQRAGASIVHYRKPPPPQPPLDPKLRLELCASFAQEVDTLSRLLDRDLSHWCRDPAGE